MPTIGETAKRIADSHSIDIRDALIIATRYAVELQADPLGPEGGHGPYAPSAEISAAHADTICAWVAHDVDKEDTT